MANRLKGEVCCAQNIPKTKYIYGLIWNSFVSYQSTKKKQFSVHMYKYNWKGRRRETIVNFSINQTGNKVNQKRQSKSHQIFKFFDVWLWLRFIITPLHCIESLFSLRYWNESVTWTYILLTFRVLWNNKTICSTSSCKFTKNVDLYYTLIRQE